MSMRLMSGYLKSGLVEDKARSGVRPSNRVPFKDLFYKAQLDWIKDPSPVLIADKGRQVGFTQSTAVKAVLECLLGNHVYYSSFNKDTTENFIRYCVRAAKAFNVIFKSRFDKSIVSSDGILTYKIKLSNGFTINALAGNATNLRDKGGIIIIDEAAFRDDLELIMDAANAILIWGGKLWIFSTHFGVDNYFNYLISVARERGYSRHHIPFRLAVSQGMYKLICRKLGIDWSQEREDNWVADIYMKYGVGASQELDCIPSEDSALGMFKNFTFYNDPEIPDIVMRVRSWDLAATELGGCFSVGSLIGYCRNDKYLLLDCQYGQWGPIEGDLKLVEIAKRDGPSVKILIEAEQGSESLRWQQYIRNLLPGYWIEFKHPESDKLTRAIPLADSIFQSNFLFLKSPTSDVVIDNMKKFSQKKKPLVTDIVDSLSQGHNYLSAMFKKSMLS